MVVVNLAGFNYPVKMSNGKEVVIPFYNPPRPVMIPDEAAGKFGGEIKVLRPPAPKVEPKPEPIVEVKKNHVKKKSSKPLDGVKIKKKRREELLKYFKGKRENK